MLHWNSWWVQSAATPADKLAPLLPRDIASWTPEGWLAWQMKLWDQSWEASLAWWRLYGVTLPAMSWQRGLIDAPQAEAAAAPRALPASAPKLARAPSAKRRATAAALPPTVQTPTQPSA